MEVLGFWVNEALWACGGLSTDQWEWAKKLSVVAKLDLLCSRLAERGMEGLVSRSGPLKESLAAELLQEAILSVGFLLSRDVKVFLDASRSASGPILFAPFPIEGFVSTFVQFYSCFHLPPVEEEVVL
ncbi:hypothetical protein KI387_006017, partial [Taxus chinensis]